MVVSSGSAKVVTVLVTQFMIVEVDRADVVCGGGVDLGVENVTRTPVEVGLKGQGSVPVVATE